MRHSRSQEFAEALRTGEDTRRRSDRWRVTTTDPNAAIALALRADALRSAWRREIPDRLAFLEERCRGRTILDVGCVDHEVASMNSPLWLHGRLAAVAHRCLGVDALVDGVAHMRQLGYSAVVHDFRNGVGALAAEGPFDVIVAGEFIEHVEHLDVLFLLARVALAPGGQLILTTPNPYAPHRVRAARRGVVWENVDHVMYAFPSGIVELAERHSLRLLEAATVSGPSRNGPLDWRGAVVRRLRGTQSTLVGIASRGPREVKKVESGLASRVLRRFLLPRRPFSGETFVYVIGHADGSNEFADTENM